MPRQIRAFYKFHVYFTVRRALYQMGDTQSLSALPGDPALNQFNNPYNAPSYDKICDEFAINPSSDFPFTHGANHGLGSVYVSSGTWKSPYKYPGWIKFSDEGGKAIDGNLTDFIELNDVPQYHWFAPNKSSGLTQASLSRINQSIEAFVPWARR